jgi:phosphoribosylamine---glycine ligase
MKILQIGSGGREHALAWKLVQSPQVERLILAPGNDGAARLPKTDKVAIAVDDLTRLRDFALNQQIDLAVVGPEAPLAAGIVDLFTEAGLAIFGPSQAAARLESSKAFSKQFMERHGIPTAQAAVVDNYEAAIRHLRQLDQPPVIKASGLAAGKGVLLPETMAEAEQVLRTILLDHRFGSAGDTVLLEERLTGPELSVLAFTDGKTARLTPAAQDHKRLLDGDRGPNTGGMGAFAPSPLATPELLAQVEREVIQPTLVGMVAEGAPYRGMLYAGLMLTPAGPKVLEFNCRLGDPEAQVVLPLLESDLVDLLFASVNGTLDRVTPRWRNGAAVTVVMAAGGYPDEYTRGHTITGVEQAEAQGCLVFHAGARRHEDRLVTDGGRVLNVTGFGPTIGAAADHAYAGVSAIHFERASYRRDIGGQK